MANSTSKAELTLFSRYVIDSSFILDFWNDGNGYPKDVPPFKGIWNHIDTLVNNGEIISTEEIYEELKDDDKKELVRWLKGNKRMFFDVDLNQTSMVELIVNKYQNLTFESGADPFVVALAKQHGLTVLTTEKPSGGAQTPKIPDLCKEHGVCCMDIPGFCKAEF